MDWRLIFAGFVVCVGLLVGWLQFETPSGAILTAIFALILFVGGWLIDEYIYRP